MNEETKLCRCKMREKERTPEDLKALMHRLNRIEGQIRGIKKMLEKNAYCTDIIVQVMAATAALNAFNREILSEHIKTCVADDIKDGNTEAMEDLINTVRRLMK